MTVAAQAEDAADEIQITPEMIAAGMDAFADYDSNYETPREAVQLIYEAMRRRSPEFRRSRPDNVAPASDINCAQ